MDPHSLDLSASSSSDEGQWSPSCSPSHQEMDVSDRLNHNNSNNNRKKRSLDQSHSSSDDDDDDDGEGGVSDSEEGVGGSGESIDDGMMNTDPLLALSTAKSSRTRRVVGLAMSRLSELECIKSQRKLSSDENREYKKLKRQRQNRDAAANSRKKKKQKLDSLEELVNGFKKQNEELIAKLREALKENEALKTSVETMKKKLGDNKDSNEIINNSTNNNTIIMKEEPIAPQISSSPSLSSPPPSSSSSMIINGGQSLLRANTMDSLSNHSVESADGMMINDEIIVTPPTASGPLSLSCITANESNEAMIGSLENAYQQYQFVSMMEGLFQTIDSSIINHNTDVIDPLLSNNHNSSLSELPCSSNELFDQGITSNTLPLFRSSSLISSISAAKDASVMHDHSSLDTLYGFAPLSSAFQDAY